MLAMTIPPALRDRPFTRAEALRLGLSDQALRGSRFKRLVRGVYVCADVPMTFETYLSAGILLLGDEARATHLTGLRCYGVEVGSELPVRFASTQPHRSRCDWVQVIRRMRVADCQGPAVCPEQCWVDACLDLDLVDAVIAADWLIHNNATTLTRLTRFVEATDNWEGICNARIALPYVREDVRSPRETVTRLLLVLAGLPGPDTCNLNVYDDDRFLGCGDLVWVAYRLVVEYDGRQHAEDTAQWNLDLDRVQGFDDAGWRFYRVTNQRLRAPRDVVRRAYGLLIEGGYTGPEPVFNSQWSRLFERRPASTR
ncbi:DUF559 domain-containing protein [Nocardioidaceae bacterium SCSIO 66511]|nr:DUF559 domain-containing protein [Nocardioidaceae bacterium SCSIO 66511]